ncbi:CU044_5270 family protein [Dactylosporangium sp. McL0621]|uniref:CU044_5270 family protein n=1 Tax=Dactylosporangium sp. McL0621 TaxID=3415678 RepID=UPI003CF7522A
MNDTMRALSEARPSRLDAPAVPPLGPAYSRPNPNRSPRRRWILTGTAVAAAMAITGVAIAYATPEKPPATASPRTADAPSAAVETNILLVAATQNEGATIREGRYWVLRRTNGDGRQAMTDEQWLATRPGDATTAFMHPGNGPWSARPMEGHTAANNFLLAGRTHSVAELNALPTDPDALKAKLLTWHEQENEQAFLFYGGAALVLDLPVPAAVRAAAYRMLAALPGITTLGPATDALGRPGVAVAYARRGDSGAVGEQRLIIDPATGRALAQESWTGGKRLSYTAVVKAEFSDGPIPDAGSIN